MLIPYIAIIAVVSYLLGGFNGAIVASKYILKKDVRGFGSGNAGITNFYRTFGGPWTLLVFGGDVIKCVLAAILGGMLLGSLGYANEGKLLAGLFVLIGHMFPVFFGFKGGKGVLSGGTLAAMLDWRVFLAVISVFLIAVLLTRYVSLGSILGGLFFPFATYIFLSGNVILTLLSACSGGLIVFMHRENIKRIIKREESKFSFHREK